MKNTFELFLSFFVFLSCSNKGEKETVNIPQKDSVEFAAVADAPLLDLVEGEQFYKNKDPFGALIELTSKQIIADTAIFKPIVIKGNRLIVMNSNTPLMLFQLPEMSYRGIERDGPNELLFPSLIPSSDNSTLCYQHNRRLIYKFTDNNELIYNEYKFADKEKQSDEKQMHQTKTDEFVYVEKSVTGQSIFRVNVKNERERHTLLGYMCRKRICFFLNSGRKPSDIWRESKKTFIIFSLNNTTGKEILSNVTS